MPTQTSMRQSPVRMPFLFTIRNFSAGIVMRFANRFAYLIAPWLRPPNPEAAKPPLPIPRVTLRGH